MASNIDDYLGQNKVARTAGGFYLAFILASALASASGISG